MESGHRSCHPVSMQVLETFEIERGLIVAVEAPTNLPVARQLLALVTRGDGTTVSAPAFKEWLLRRDPHPLESEAFLLRGLRKADVPLGSSIELSVGGNSS